ncbi:MAG TPA: putative quinol monooxygenase [Dongiaceae bacterium]|jgi:quinol monooxygenase YgiN|nr:putative quinol monooxygenase [Dongiaceae bacterium]
MKGFVIVVDFEIRPGAMQDFRRLVDANAKASVRDEPGCRRFDVLANPKDANRILLYEIYDDRAAFDAHRRTPHFAVFDRESAALVADKTVGEYDLVCEGSAA